MIKGNKDVCNSEADHYKINARDFFVPSQVIDYICLMTGRCSFICMPFIYFYQWKRSCSIKYLS